jgi:hypothetical protein
MITFHNSVYGNVNYVMPPAMFNAIIPDREFTMSLSCFVNPFFFFFFKKKSCCPGDS